MRIQTTDIADYLKTTLIHVVEQKIVPFAPLCVGIGRRFVSPKMNMKDLNEKLSIISRTVVHPKYRTIGLGHITRQYVEMPAVMAKYNHFAEKAGMQKIANNRHQKKL